MLNVAEITDTTSLPAGGSYASLTSIQAEIHNDKASGANTSTNSQTTNSHLIPTNDTVHLSPKAKATVLFNQGFNVQEIADDLGITSQTVDSYLKLSAPSSTVKAGTEHASTLHNAIHGASNQNQEAPNGTASTAASNSTGGSGNNSKTSTGSNASLNANNSDQNPKSAISGAQDIQLQ